MSKSDFDYWWFVDGARMMPNGYTDENEKHYKEIAEAAYQYGIVSEREKCNDVFDGKVASDKS